MKGNVLELVRDRYKYDKMFILNDFATESNQKQTHMSNLIANPAILIHCVGQ